MNTNSFPDFLQLLNELEQKKISYTLAHNREDAVMVIVATPGERWEIEFLSDGSIEIEKFISTGEITGVESLRELFVRYEDQDETANSSKEVSVATPVSKIA
jgi:hypothetical protein